MNLICFSSSQEDLATKDIGNVILGLLGGQKHHPNKESAISKVLQDCLSPDNCKIVFVGHISPDSKNYPETLKTLQLSAKLQKLSRRRTRRIPSSSGRLARGNPALSSASATGASSSELSCDPEVPKTVGQQDGCNTDSKRPPERLSSFQSLDITTSCRPRQPRILTNGAFLHGYCMSPSLRSRLAAGPACQTVRSPFHCKILDLSRPRCDGCNPEGRLCPEENCGYVDQVNTTEIKSWVESTSEPQNPPVLKLMTQLKSVENDCPSCLDEEMKNQPPLLSFRKDNPREDRQVTFNLNLRGKSDLQQKGFRFDIPEIRKSHPLRILSEEDLTCVSSFPSRTHPDKIDPSRFSFFGLPDFSIRNDDELSSQTGKDQPEIEKQASPDLTAEELGHLLMKDLKIKAVSYLFVWDKSNFENNLRSLSNSYFFS